MENLFLWKNASLHIAQNLNIFSTWLPLHEYFNNLLYRNFLEEIAQPRALQKNVRPNVC